MADVSKHGLIPNFFVIDLVVVSISRSARKYLFCIPARLPGPNGRCRSYLGDLKLNVVCRRRTFFGTSAHYSDAGALTRLSVRPRRIAESTAEFSRKMRIVAKAARVSDLAKRLARAQQGAMV
jgi:hypothetical protein